jgi:hypothetical protein
MDASTQNSVADPNSHPRQFEVFYTEDLAKKGQYKILFSVQFKDD